MSKELPHREAVERLSLWGYAFLPAADALAAVEKAGGSVVGIYKEPLGGHPVLLAVLRHRR